MIFLMALVYHNNKKISIVLDIFLEFCNFFVHFLVKTRIVIIKKIAKPAQTIKNVRPDKTI